MRNIFFLFSLLCFVVACTPTEPTDSSKSFVKLKASKTGLDFSNPIKESESVNHLIYQYMYNGGGVAAGDLNNDDLPELYFTANQGPDRLYMNKGGFVFEDISANLASDEQLSGWSTGVSMVDINADGLLDIYVCKAGPECPPEQRKNQLWINKGENEFEEAAAAFGLDDSGYSTQAIFFDYDQDLDLDMYLISHRIDFTSNSTLVKKTEIQINPETRDRLYRNEGNNKFTDITDQAGILNNSWGLSGFVMDFNEDGWEDVYVCNDFLDADFVYINNQQGGFTEQAMSTVRHMSFYSMGSDLGDINNDGLIDFMVLDMVSEDHARSKRNMASMDVSQFFSMVRWGYHFQYMHNMLQLNTGNGTFSEIAQLSGVAKTDWSWSPLFADFDNDGWQDLLITNGIKYDVTDNDVRMAYQKMVQSGEEVSYKKSLKLMPSEKQPNYLFKNNRDLTFSKANKEWGLEEAVNSNGAAYTDLNNDGALDLVLNNLDGTCAVYENTMDGNYLKIKLNGYEGNPFGIGSKVTIYTQNGKQTTKLLSGRGYLSSVEPYFHFGLGEIDVVDKVKVTWPNGIEKTIINVKGNQTLEVQYLSDKPESVVSNPAPHLNEVDLTAKNMTYVHRENIHNDYALEILLPHSQSQHGPLMSVGDVNEDGLDDLFIGNSVGTPGVLLIQNQDGTFRSGDNSFLTQDAGCEDLGSVFFDADGDQDLDLYVVSGGNEFNFNSPELQDRLYLNDGKGNFTKAQNALPQMLYSGYRVVAEDIDKDGDLDLFVGGRVVPKQYPRSPNSCLLLNEGGTFKDITAEKAPELQQIGMVTGAVFTDYDQDGDPDLALAGEWMPVVLMNNDGGSFKQVQNYQGLSATTGLWFSLTAVDVDGDGDEDLVAGNIGLNTKFKTGENKSFHVFANDFDNNGRFDIVLSNEINGDLVPVRGLECSSEQMPFIKVKFPTYEAFAEAKLDEIYGENDLESAVHFEANTLSSCIFFNEGANGFKRVELPNEAQVGPILSCIPLDVDKDGKMELIVGGNLFGAEVETTRYDASVGLVLKINDDNTIQPVHPQESGLRFQGDVKDMTLFHIGKGKANPVIVGSRHGFYLQGFEIMDSEEN